ncbi:MULTISPECIES: 50S ribosomal protein L25/general stress protein Ctc [unclassified Corynebacterium]|uniref:50S ribosomal protein L25/general stress protein Ctc n=1 Tax=unclassified Corynebacterium TaxID=2624378 RepID=UPI001EF745D2|nr:MULTISPECIES: 50S ribosomal protein L25/general stress protein Ctc [unclassified Corynebacterium]MCG7288608.1 50S ribosomal protein L25/general stress protein Ctc [Corynebacterium sp. ACRPZ]MCG7293086.1 50S ribosomal protein L25/general stress protein Ctc [Corynebacterium sp. ACRPY]
MAITPTVIKGERREEFGKGSARRLRRDGKIPGVLYEKGIENIHFAVDRIEMTAIVRNDGANAIVELELDGEKLLAMVKHIDQNVITLDIDHIDLFGIKRGEKVTVEVPVVMEGEAAPGAVVLQETDYVEIEIDALSIPDELTVSIEGKEIGDALYASDVKLPEGAELTSDAETLIVNVTYEQVDEDLEAEAEAAEEGGAEAGAESDAPAEEKGEE